MVTLKNSVGQETKYCSVSFIEGATCNCAQYCGAGCESKVKTGNFNDKAFNDCLFITNATRLSFKREDPAGGYWKINGTTINTNQPCWDNANDCSNFLNNYAKVDGGWYITGNVGWASVRSSKASNPCGSSEDESTTRTIEYQNYKEYKAGKTYTLTMTYGGVFRCTYDSQSSAVTIGTFNNSSFTADAYQSQTTANNPGEGNVVTFTVTNDISGTLECANDW